MFLGYNDVTV